MKKLFAGLLLIISSSALSQDFGVGVIVGSPTGLSLEKYIDGETSIDGAFAWNLRHGRINMHSNYLIHQEKSFYLNETAFNSYYGGGLKVRKSSNDNWRIGPRAVGGADYVFEEVPIKAFAEFGAIFTLIEETGLEFDLGVGARYMF